MLIFGWACIAEIPNVSSSGLQVSGRIQGLGSSQRRNMKNLRGRC